MSFERKQERERGWPARYKASRYLRWLPKRSTVDEERESCRERERERERPTMVDVTRSPVEEQLEIYGPAAVFL